jgi:hypothetical protein
MRGISLLHGGYREFDVATRWGALRRRAARGTLLCRRGGLVGALALLAVAVSAAAGEARAQIVRPNPIQNAGVPWLFDGFRVDAPPPAGGWVSLSKSFGGAQLLRQTGTPEHTFAAVVASGPLPAGLDSDEALLALARDAIAKDLAPGGWTPLVREERVVTFQGARCVRYVERVQESGADSKRRVMEVRGMLCAHPTLPQRGVDVSVSERGAPGVIDGRWRAEGEVFIDSLRFTTPARREDRAAAVDRLKAGDPAGAAQLLEPMAAAGDPLAARLLRYAYSDKRNPRRDDALSLKWLMEAARQGDDIAQGLLAYHYRSGEGVAPDYAQAQRWMSLAADQRNPDAQAQIGTDYLFGGRGLPVDRTRARAWLELAAANGSQSARDLLSERFKGN